MNNIHMTAMKPLTNLITANLNFDRLEKMIEKSKDPASIP